MPFTRTAMNHQEVNPTVKPEVALGGDGGPSPCTGWTLVRNSAAGTRASGNSLVCACRQGQRLECGHPGADRSYSDPWDLLPKLGLPTISLSSKPRDSAPCVTSDRKPLFPRPLRAQSPTLALKRCPGHTRKSMPASSP